MISRSAPTLADKPDRAESSHQTGSQCPDMREPNLDGLRGLAIALILLCHGFNSALMPAGGTVVAAWLKAAFTYSHGGVELFFVLSGFLLGRILLRGTISRQVVAVFYLRRVLRILPAYLLLLGSLLLCRYSGWGQVPFPADYVKDNVPLWSYLLFIQNHFFAAWKTMGPSWLIVTWSLALEVQFYLLIPWLMRILSPRALIVLALGASACATLVRWSFIRNENYFGPIYSTPARIDAMFLGVVVALLWCHPASRKKIEAARHPLGIAVAVFAALFFTLPFGPGRHLDFNLIWSPLFLGVGFTLVLFWTLAAPQNAANHLLRILGFRRLGRISYFVYLFHFPAIFCFFLWLSPGDERSRFLTTLLAYFVTLALAALSWRWFESPIVALGHRVPYRQP